jgi:hypothetical protein
MDARKVNRRPVHFNEFWSVNLRIYEYKKNLQMSEKYNI